MSDLRSALADGANVTAVDELGWAALHHAAWHRQSEAIKILFEAGALTEATSTSSIRPLHLAATRNTELSAVLDARRSVATVRVLLDVCHARVNARCSDGSTAIMLAAATGLYDTVMFLCKHAGVKLDAVNSSGVSVLDLVSSTGEAGLVQAVTSASEKSSTWPQVCLYA